MVIYLDSSDLIDVFEHSTPCSGRDFAEALQTTRSEMALSFTTVLEISAPLVAGDGRTNVMRLLNRIEEAPHKFIHSARIPPLKYQEAIAAFSTHRECERVDPFVSRFDECISVEGSLPTRLYLRHSLAETVFTLWQEAPNLFIAAHRHRQRGHDVVSADRDLLNPPSLASHFQSTVARDLSMYRIQPLALGAAALVT